MLGRNSAAGMIEWTEPTWRARSTLCTASNSAATSPSLSERTAVRVSASFTRRRALCGVVGAGGELRFELAHGRVRCGTFVHLSGEHHRCRGCTADNRGERSLDGEHFHVLVQRVGEHHESSAVIARDHANTIGPSKLTMARPISAPYSSWMLRSDSGEPSKPDRFASTTRGRFPLAALIARAVFFEDCGNRVPDVHWSGPSAGHPALARDDPRFDADDAHRNSANVRVEHHGGVGVGHVGPPLEHRMVLVDHRTHDRPNVERLLAVFVGARRRRCRRRS